ncbi:shikimate kinase [Devosia sp. BK]|uniref:shikimate kinase n=1 Tax=Devosia sp. BK TaxID=2871706 RepID=UPI00293B0BED|nr:shikimate kinase [Devosia sp. BK]MDV3251737.1 shikimate kinase [Devosia sp. BK]
MVYINCRRPWQAGETLVLLGPGGVGKSTLGRELSRRLGWALIDLDELFCSVIGNIGEVIAQKGYDHYRAENLALGERCFADLKSPAIFVSSSGFLAAPPDSSDFTRAAALVEKGYGVTLLPSLDIDRATDIVVARQLTRGFGFVQSSEERKFRQRFPIYQTIGDALVVSTADAPAIADDLITTLAIA